MAGLNKYQAYPEYRDSGVEWLGEIPSHWSVSKPRYMFNFGKGLTITKENLQDHGIPCINYGEIHSKYGFEVSPKIHPLKCVDEKYIKDNSGSLLLKGDIIFADTSEDIDGSGNFSQLISDNISFAGYHTIIAKPLNRRNWRFYAYLLDCKELRTQVRHAVKGVKVFSITQAILRGLSIWLPTDDEQSKIADFLYHETVKIDNLIKKQQQLIELLKEKRQAVISHAVTKGLNPDVPMKDSGVAWLGKIPKHWEMSKLRYMFRFGKGLTITKEHLHDEGVPCVNYGEIHSKFGFEIDPQIHKLKCVDESYILNNPDSLIYKGDIIFADTSEDIDGAGNFTQLISDNQIFAGYHTIILRPLNRESLRFYAYIFDSKALRAQISNAVKGVKVFSITQAILRSTSIWFPPLSERERIVAFLDNQTIKIDTLIEKQLHQIALLKERRTALISAAVTGKIDLRNWTAPIPEAETPTEASA
ncbi:TPA: restriction endonuclease subunit S [Escherichia coli]|nr:restriction endonuclease subunit S [Escherichia coli]